MGSIPDDKKAAQKKKIDGCLEPLVSERGESFLVSVKAVLYSNLGRGRIRKFTEQNSIDLEDYVMRVVDYYDQLQEYVRSIQVEKMNEVWVPLKAKLDSWAYRYLRKKGFNPGTHTNGLARDYASDTAITIMNAHFPYDTDFEPWAFIVLLNVCRQKISKATRKSKIPDYMITDLDDDLWWLADPEAGDIEGRTGRKQLVQDAIEKLPSDQKKQVIQMRYFKGFSYQEIADLMDMKINAVYKSHFDALLFLQEILLKDLGYDT